MPPTMGGCFGYNTKRTLVTATVAVACMIPRYNANIAMVSGDSPGTTIGRSFSYHARKQQVSIPSDANGGATAIRNDTSLLKVLQTLVRRLNEPVPLRATTTTAEQEQPPSNAVEEKRRMAEFADELVVRYSSLPPLRRFGMPKNENDDDEILEDHCFCERSDILEFLATECCPSEASVKAAVDDYRKQHEASNHSEKQLKVALTPIYEGLTEFILQQNAVTGMGFLVSLREDLLSSMRYQTHEASAEPPASRDNNGSHRHAKYRRQKFKDLDSHLKSGFQRWFAPGLLSHERITYDSTPAKIIEAIATKEAVHPMKSLDDLKDRLGDSKRVFALFHPCLPDQPLVFVHVALLPHGLPSSMEEIMASKNNKNNNSERNDGQQHRPEAAVFYSISNGVKGLAGVGLGEYLLKESINALKEELPCLQTFVTLSPIPNFRKWIKVAFLKEEQKHQQRLRKGSKNKDSSSVENEESSSSLLSRNDREALHRCGLVSSTTPFPWHEFLDTLEEMDFSNLIHKAKTTTDRDIYSFLLNNDGDGGDNNEPASALLSPTVKPPKHQQRQQNNDSLLQERTQFFVLRRVLSKLASSYLWLEKHRGKPLDKVCAFHVGNGAELHDLHFGADLSRGGLSNSYGLMANYLYYNDTETVSRNQANFESPGFVVPVGPGVRKWLEQEDEEVNQNNSPGFSNVENPFHQS